MNKDDFDSAIIERMFHEYRYFSIKCLGDTMEYDFCSGKYTVKHGFWSKLVYKGKNFDEALDIFFEGIKDYKY